MTPDQFKAEIAALGLNQSSLARRLGIHLRTVRRYVAGEWPIPPMLELALDGIRWRDNPSLTPPTTRAK